jgi:serpin B
MLADPGLELADKNAVFSPTSIALALAMARAGARDDTASQMDAVLHTSGWDELGPGLNALDQVLAQRNETWQEYDQGPTYELALRIANAAFGQRGWPIEPTYLDRIASTFGAGVRLVDYAADYEAARKLINGWVSDQTASRIPDLLNPGSVNPSTRLVLANAVYLKAVWEAHFFGEWWTRPAAFTRLDGSRVMVPTMRGESLGLGTEVPFVHGTGWQATEVRYSDAAGTMPLAMTLVLPDDLSSFESRLSASQLGRITGALDSERRRLGSGAGGCPGEEHNYDYRLVVELPRFGVETKADLIPALRTLGISDAFDGSRADFTGTSAEQPLYIGLVVHQANISVDENGTEAAAATGVGDTGGPGATACRDISLQLNKPFLFFLRDVETGAVLFMGRVVDPSVGRTGS